MSYGGVIGRPGWSVVGSCLVVNKRRLSMCDMLVVDCSYRSCMVDLLVVVMGTRVLRGGGTGLVRPRIVWEPGGVGEVLQVTASE